MDTITTEIYQRVILGTAIGDSMGLPAENLSSRAVRRRWKGRWKQQFLFRYGMVTDDTEHTIWVVRSLMEAPDNAEKFQKRLASRLRWWLLGMPAAIGFATLRALIKLWMGVRPGNNGIYSAGNGPCMRCAIIGSFFYNNDQSLREFVRASTRLTHTDPRAETAALAIAFTAARLTSNVIQGKAGKPDMLPSWRELSAGDKEWNGILDKYASCKSANKTVPEFAHEMGLERGVSGYAYHSVPVALYAWDYHYGDYKTGLEFVLNCGGDTDTVGAIYGALAAIADSPPHNWVSHLKDYPLSVSFLNRQAEDLSHVHGTGQSRKPSFFPWFIVPFRNLFFFLLVLIHILRRLLPF